MEVFLRQAKAAQSIIFIDYVDNVDVGSAYKNAGLPIRCLKNSD